MVPRLAGCLVLLQRDDAIGPVHAPQEKGRLLPFDRKPGMKFQELISIVGDQSFVVRDAV